MRARGNAVTSLSIPTRRAGGFAVPCSGDGVGNGRMFLGVSFHLGRTRPLLATNRIVTCTRLPIIAGRTYSNSYDGVLTRNGNGGGVGLTSGGGGIMTIAAPGLAFGVSHSANLVSRCTCGNGSLLNRNNALGPGF